MTCPNVKLNPSFSVFISVSQGNTLTLLRKLLSLAKDNLATQIEYHPFKQELSFAKGGTKGKASVSTTKVYEAQVEFTVLGDNLHCDIEELILNRVGQDLIASASTYSVREVYAREES